MKQRLLSILTFIVFVISICQSSIVFGMEEYGELGQAGDWEQQIKELAAEEAKEAQKEALHIKIQHIKKKLSEIKHALKRSPWPTIKKKEKLSSAKQRLIRRVHYLQGEGLKLQRQLFELQQQLNALDKEPDVISSEEEFEEILPSWLFKSQEESEESQEAMQESGDLEDWLLLEPSSSIPPLEQPKKRGWFW